MFAVKQIVGVWLMPLPLGASLVALGLLLLALGRRRAGRIAGAIGIAIALLATLGVVTNSLLLPLETRQAAVLDVARLSPLPQYVVVLGSGYRPRDDLPVTSALEATAVVRLMEGLRLFRQLPQSTLVLSGGAVNDQPPSAVGYAKAARALGVASASIVLIDDALDTSAEIRSLRRIAGDAPVLLVTSASHMPRAMAYCQHYGVHAVAAPTGHVAEPASTWGLRDWLVPSGVHLRNTETALHEYLGLLALRLGVV